MRNSLQYTVQYWEIMLKRVYETQGPSGLAKYQYSIAGILQVTEAGSSLQKMLEYCTDIPDPKDVLIDAIFEIMLNHSVDTDAKVASAATLRTLIPRMKNYPGLSAMLIVEKMKQVLAETQEESLQDALTETINAATAI